MIRYSSEVTIQRSPADVLDALLDPARYADWTDMVEMQFGREARLGVGAKGTFRFAKGPISGPLEVEVTEIEPNRRVVMRITHPSLDWTSVSTLAAEGSGTRLTYAGELQLKGWRRLLEPVVAGELGGGEAKEVKRLKAILERESPVAAVPA
jgi:uncharacterized protein YndB with AHSA1/START domain